MKPKILAIDDSLTLREFINRSLTRHFSDYQILLAKDGTEGLAMAAGELPELILLDFLLPDMKGDKVCRHLLDNPKTAGIPVILMSSSAGEIKRTQAEFSNAVKAIAKPFTPELLCAAVGYVLRDLAKKSPAPQKSEVAEVAGSASQNLTGMTVPQVMEPVQPVALERQLCGDTGQFSVVNTLLALEQDQLTGLLSFSVAAQPIELHVANGHPVLVTSRDVNAYLKGTTYVFSPEQTHTLNQVAKVQKADGSPVFMAFASDQLMSTTDAFAQCRTHGLKLFAGVWTASRVPFRFDANVQLPGLTTALPPYEGVMSEWAMETLRYVGDDFRSAMAWGEPTGIPAYTRRGYERIQQIPLNDEELAFAALISPTTSLAQIANSMKIDVDHAQRILYRFLCLEIFDYWPASLLLAA